MPSFFVENSYRNYWRTLLFELEFPLLTAEFAEVFVLCLLAGVGDSSF